VDVLHQFAWSTVLVAFDFDGTLAPIVEDPTTASLRPATKALLRKLSRRYPCVVISGRTAPDLRKRLHGVELAGVLGNHGMAPTEKGVGYPRGLFEKVRGWLPSLIGRLGSLKGVKIEDKGISLAIHYRQSREKRRASREVEAAIVDLQGVRIIRGKLVFNLLPEGAPHKGLALRSARERLGCDTAIYVGDDVSDEDVFALDEPGRLLGIRVEKSAASHASYFLRKQQEVDDFLHVLLACRASVKARGPSTVGHAA